MEASSLYLNAGRGQGRQQAHKHGAHWLVCSTKAEASEAINASKASSELAKARCGLALGVLAAVFTPSRRGDPRLQATSSPG